MKAGEFPDGARVLRAKIQVDAANVWMRDPLIYRIKHADHHQTGGKWCIYPMYDFAHCLSDYIEGITHSICTLEFEVHRPLYDWILESLGLPRPLPKQYEFAKLIPSHTIVSKRKLIQLVNENIVSGWDDPRMPTDRKSTRLNSSHLVISYAVFFFLRIRRPPRSPLFPYTTPFRSHTIVSKRKLIQLVNENIVSGWDDPRMP